MQNHLKVVSGLGSPLRPAATGLCGLDCEADSYLGELDHLRWLSGRHGLAPALQGVTERHIRAVKCRSK